MALSKLISPQPADDSDPSSFLNSLFMQHANAAKDSGVSKGENFQFMEKGKPLDPASVLALIQQSKEQTPENPQMDQLKALTDYSQHLPAQMDFSDLADIANKIAPPGAKPVKIQAPSEAASPEGRMSTYAGMLGKIADLKEKENARQLEMLKNLGTLNQGETSLTLGQKDPLEKMMGYQNSLATDTLHKTGTMNKDLSDASEKFAKLRSVIQSGNVAQILTMKPEITMAVDNVKRYATPEGADTVSSSAGNIVSEAQRKFDAGAKFSPEETSNLLSLVDKSDMEAKNAAHYTAQLNKQNSMNHPAYFEGIGKMWDNTDPILRQQQSAAATAGSAPSNQPINPSPAWLPPGAVKMQKNSATGAIRYLDANGNVLNGAK